MTEATHQMASNPLPPHAQKPGSVGVAAGPELRICLLYTSDAADERSSVDLGGRRIIKKKKKKQRNESM